MYTYAIRKKSDETFDIFRNNTLIHPSVAANLLERQLAPYGILEGTYEDVMSQLAQGNEATVEIPLVKMWQVS